ncbi:hypothetical protein ACVDG9_18340 [Roseibium sp. RP-7]
MKELKRAHRLRQMSMDTLVKRVTSSSSHRDPLVSYEVVEIDDRLPPDLKTWYSYILFTIREPWHLRGGRGGSDEAYIEHWRDKRDRLHPKLNPNYKPPRKRAEDDGDDEGDGGSPVSPPGL